MKNICPAIIKSMLIYIYHEIIEKSEMPRKVAEIVEMQSLLACSKNCSFLY